MSMADTSVEDDDDLHTLPLPEGSLETLRAYLMEVTEVHEDAESDARVIIEALPRVVPGAILTITCSAMHDPGNDGGLTFRSVTFDLTEELVCSAAETYKCPHAGSDTSSLPIFECRPDGFSEGDLVEWIDLAQSLSASIISVHAELPPMAEKEEGTSSEGPDEVDKDGDDDDWPDAGGVFDPRTLSIEARRRCDLLPTAVERAKEDADHVCEVIQAAINDIVTERGRMKSQTGRLFSLSVLFALFAGATYLLGGHPAWIAPVLVACLTGASAAECAARRGGLDIAISTSEQRLTHQGVSIDWAGRGNQAKAVVRWKALELRLKYAATIAADPDFTREK